VPRATAWIPCQTPRRDFCRMRKRRGQRLELAEGTSPRERLCLCADKAVKPSKARQVFFPFCISAPTLSPLCRWSWYFLCSSAECLLLLQQSHFDAGNGLGTGLGTTIKIFEHARNGASTPEAAPEAPPRLYISALCSSPAAAASDSAASPHRPGHHDQKRAKMLIKGRRHVCAAKLRPSLRLFEGTSPRGELLVRCLRAEGLHSF
jgi:hypothetical protein